MRSSSAKWHVRASPGLKPRPEKTLFWDPGKRVTARGGSAVPPVRETPEGVLVNDGACFEHDGNCVRTVYPFPANKVGKVKGLRTHRFPQTGKTLPLNTATAADM